MLTGRLTWNGTHLNLGGKPYAGVGLNIVDLGQWGENIRALEDAAAYSVPFVRFAAAPYWADELQRDISCGGGSADGLGDLAVIARCLDGDERTPRAPASRSPAWDATLFFSKSDVDEREVEGASLRLRVYDLSTRLRECLVGEHSIDLLSIFYRPNRTLARKWIALASPTAADGAVCGYLRISVQLCAPGDELQPMPEADDDADDAGATADGGALGSTVLMPPTLKSTVHFLRVAVRRAEELPRMNSRFKSTEIDAFVAVSFNGYDVKTAHGSDAALALLAV